MRFAIRVLAAILIGNGIWKVNAEIVDSTLCAARCVVLIVVSESACPVLIKPMHNTKHSRRESRARRAPYSRNMSCDLSDALSGKKKVRKYVPKVACSEGQNFEGKALGFDH